MNWCYPNCKHCIATVFRFFFKTITVIVPLQKFREKLSKGAITNDHSNGSTSPSRLSTNVTITEKLKNLKFSQKVAVFTRNRTNKQLWQKVTIPFLFAKIQHFVSITNINNNNPKLIDVMVLRKHLSGVVSNLEPIPQFYGFMSTPCRSPLKPRIKNENENCLWALRKWKLKQTNLSFPINKTTKEKLQQNNFSNYFTFSPTEINRTPRSLLQRF